METNSPRVIVLVATIPARRALCERLLGELARQSRPPDAVLLRLDGYGADEPMPRSALPVLAFHRAPQKEGPGARWLFALWAMSTTKLDPDDIVVCIDDDAVLVEAPEFIAGLIMAVEKGGGAAAAMGRDAEGKPAPPGPAGRGPIVHAAGLGLTVRARHLEGLPEFAQEIVKLGGPDALGQLGDDDALVSAHLWRKGIPIFHAATGNVFEAPAAKASAHSVMRGRVGEQMDAQKLAIRRVTGWPFVSRVN